jgi:hypothetical protein
MNFPLSFNTVATTQTVIFRRYNILTFLNRNRPTLYPCRPQRSGHSGNTPYAKITDVVLTYSDYVTAFETEQSHLIGKTVRLLKQWSFMRSLIFDHSFDCSSTRETKGAELLRQLLLHMTDAGSLTHRIS